MLFVVKNHAGWSLALLALFAAVAWPTHTALGLQWRFDLGGGELIRLLAGIGLLAASDGGLHGLAWLVWRRAYLDRYRQLIDFFASQGSLALLAGSLLAGGEELVFRGLVLEGLRSRLDWSNGAAVITSGLIFGLCHVIPRRGLLPFGVWACWEGILLGVVYVWSGSLLVAILVHVLHDLVGFSLFALQRRTGWLMASRAL